ncbi:MAG: MerR family transcriptional regulator [Clostridium sp.]|uniref:MerR family transcriptional regulator n=1 Tax=Clostridium sp. TaxID=1506 RepID=UPI0030312DEB
MNTRFSIGEVAKLNNVSIRTLRHYDKIGLLKPAYVNEKSKYRYYSVKHFMILDLIKQCKAMGLSLDEIKILVNNYTSINSILDIITKQKEIVEEKMKELDNIKSNICFLENRIQTLLEEGMDRVFVKYFSERKFVKYNNAQRYTEEFEINLSKTLGDIDKKYGSTNKELVFSTSYEDFKNQDKLTYNNMMISIKGDIESDGNKIVTLKSGYYITINFDDDYKDTTKYYGTLDDYIEENNIKVSGDFYEIYIMTRGGIDNEEKSLGQIQILIDNV